MGGISSGWRCSTCGAFTAFGFTHVCTVGFYPAPMGCICPPTSEKTCQGAYCPRRGHNASLGTGVASAEGGEA